MNGEPPPMVVEARGLSRRFGHQLAVDGVDLAVSQGEVFGFLGPNGAGKSTLIRMLVGLLSPTSGEITTLGCELPREAEALRSRVGYMTQRFSLYEELSVAENLEFVAEVFGLARSEARSRVAEVADEFDLGEVLTQRPAVLSGGWRQRLALAAATLHRPSLLVLDEPTAGVDPDRRRAFWDKIFDLSARGVTVLVSTHYMDEAVRCHRLCMLRRGRLVGKGRPAELAAALSGRVIEVAAEPPERAIAALRRHPDVASVTQLGSSVHVLLRRGAPPAAEVAPRLAAALREVVAGPRAQPTVATLEDVFVALSHDDFGGGGEGRPS